MAKATVVTPEARHHVSYVPMLSIKERDFRWAQIRERMVVDGIDVLVIVGNDIKWGAGLAAVRYVTHIASGSGAYAVFPIVGEPVVWADLPHQFMPESRYLHTQNWVNDIRPDQGAPPIIAWLKENGFAKSKIGLVGFAASIISGDNISHGFYTQLEKGLPEAEIVMATGIVNHMQIIKSPEEIEWLEQAGILVNKTLHKFIASAEPGKKECEVYADMVAEQIKNGGECQIFIMMTSGPIEGPGVNKQLIHGNHQPTVPTTRVLEKGDLIMFEMHASYGGYLAAAEFSMVLGKAPKQIKALHDVCVACGEAIKDAMRPGVTFRNALIAERKPCLDAGMEYLELGFHQHGLTSAGPLTVVYHSAEKSKLGGYTKMDLVFRENMVFGTNLDINDPRWKPDVGLVLGDTIHITAKGGRKLSNTPTDIIEKIV